MTAHELRIFFLQSAASSDADRDVYSQSPFYLILKMGRIFL